MSRRMVYTCDFCRRELSAASQTFQFDLTFYDEGGSTRGISPKGSDARPDMCRSCADRMLSALGVRLKKRADGVVELIPIRKRGKK